MTIKAIEARFTSGNDIPVQKAMVPADEWKAAKAEIERRDAVLRVALEAFSEVAAWESSGDLSHPASKAIKAIQEVLG